MTYLHLNAEATVDSFPAYKVVRRELTTAAYIKGKRVDISFTEIQAGDKLGVKTNRGYYNEYYPGSVVSYALENGEDPIEAIETAKSRGHELHWINACAVSITSHSRPQETLILVEPGMVVRFEGKLFTIKKAPNNNLQLVPYAV